ncbi:MAG: hypothetical protein QOG10_4836 [Kribbellaceae bacterium]|jgi:hypothetical protein|nr:hypothetical protein [Kribbellaceae bacterium]
MNETLINLFAAIGLSVTCSAIGGLLSWNVAGLWIKARRRRARGRQARAALAPEGGLGPLSSRGATTGIIQGLDCSDPATLVDHIKG